MVDPKNVKDLENTRAEVPLSRPIVIPYRPRNLWKGEVRFINGCIEKDHDSNPFLPRLYARICLNLEETALKRLSGIKGVPHFIERPTRTSLRMTAVPGVPLGKLNKGDLSELCFSRIKDILDEIHRNGVAHCDLHMRNILIDNDDPYIIDFATAYTTGHFPVWDRKIFQLLTQLDLQRIYKVEKKFFGRGTPPKMFFIYKIIKGLK
jgi:RIO-like serine/threonine protein kinase